MTDKDWQIFRGQEQPHDDIVNLPAPPSWREFSSHSDSYLERQEKRGKTFKARKEEIEMVNAALYLRRPLLITGKPGSGKSTLAYAVARELKLGEVLYWPITTRTTLKDGLYAYDAIGRLQEQGRDNLHKIGNYITLGPLGTALLPTSKPRVLLVDEIDKSDIDLPNDLLHVFEEGYFEIPELVRIEGELSHVRVRTPDSKAKSETTVTEDSEGSSDNQAHEDGTVEIVRGRVRCSTFPFVLMTSNGERDFPPPFLRRCLRLTMEKRTEKELADIVIAHLGEEAAQESKTLIHSFFESAQEGDLATDQLLNAVYLITRDRSPDTVTFERLKKKLLQYLNK